MITLPIYYTETYKTKPDKTLLVSLNWYRNAVHFQQNKVKQYYHSLVASQLPPAITGPYRLHIDLYYKNPSSDGSNIVALSEKMVLDALQEHHIITNDNVLYHLGTTWAIAGQDKLNPRVEITIIPT